MSGIDNIIRLVNDYLKTVWCYSAQAEFSGFAEFVDDNGQQLPACVRDGSAVPFLPDSTTQFRLFWMLDGDIIIEEDEDEGYGENDDRTMSAPVNLFLIAPRSLLGPECAYTVRGLASSLQDALPTNSINAGATMQHVWVQDIRVNADPRTVLAELYGSLSKPAQHSIDLVAIRLSMTIFTDFCGAICDDSLGELCEDATVRNSAGTVLGTVAAGDIFTVDDSAVSNSDDSYVVSLPATVSLEIPDSEVSNSDDSYLVAVPATQPLELPDVQISNSDDTYSAVIPAVQDHEIPDINVQVIDQDLNVLHNASHPAAVNLVIPVVTGGGSSTVTFQYAAAFAGQEHLFYRAGFNGEFKSGGTNLDNIDAFEFFVNGVSQGSANDAFTFNAGDRIYLSVNHTNKGDASSIQINCDGITSPLVIASRDYFITRGMSWQENMVDLPDKLNDTDKCQQGTGSAVNYETNYIGDTPLTGDFDMLIEPSESGNSTTQWAALGLNDGSSAPTAFATRYFRQKYTWGIFSTAHRVYESGILRLNLNDNNSPAYWYKIEGRSGTVKYYKSTDNRGTWTLFHPSVVAYNPVTASLNVDGVIQVGLYTIIKPQREVQL